jgi:pyruvate ferredoxin oxidoreductase delta subunit
MAMDQIITPRLDPKKCNLCETCRLLCPELAITVENEEKAIHIDLAYCKSCGICVAFCPKGAIEMVMKEEGEEADV